MTSTTTKTISAYEAIEVLFRERHRLSADMLRSIDCIWLCASAARFGEPHEQRSPELDAAYCRDHNTAECEGPPPSRQCEGCEQTLAPDCKYWFCGDCMTAASEAF